MLNWIIDISLRYRFLVILCVTGMMAAGVVSLRYLDIDAFPDATPIQVQINTVAPALGPEEVEQRITFPVEQAIGGLPGLEQMRSISKFGFSQVVVTFKDGTVATGLGEVFHYVITGKGHDITDLRTIHDWVIKPKMRTVKGVAEINSWGGYEKQYLVPAWSNGAL